MLRTILSALAAAVVLAPAADRGAARAEEALKVSGPFTHENLSIYLLHGKSEAGPVPLTLAEALAKGSVTVHETGSVQELQVENTGEEPVFVQSGDIVKGGKQDRVLTISMLIPARSGKIPVGAFCVEEGRWTARGKEDVSRFVSADQALPSKAAKLAIKAPKEPRVAAAEPPQGPVPRENIAGNDGQRRPAVQEQRIVRGAPGLDRQGEVWKSVKETQDNLSRRLAAPVTAAQSPSSLQLSLENEKLKAAQDAYVKALDQSGLKEEDVVGFVFAINGKLNSADVYPSNGLFRKMWPKLLNASVVEALSEKQKEEKPVPAAEAPTPADILAFLKEAERGKQAEARKVVHQEVEARTNDKSYFFETRSAGGAFVHRNYLAK